MFGRNPRFPLEAEKMAESVSVERAMEDNDKVDIDDYISNIIEKQRSFSPKLTIIKVAQKKQKELYTRRKWIVQYNFKIGDKVLRRNMQQLTKKGRKMEDRWLGPYLIVEISKTSCLLKNRLRKVLKQRVNLCQLKPFNEPTIKQKMPVMSEESRESNDSIDDQMNSGILRSSGDNEVHIA